LKQKSWLSALKWLLLSFSVLSVLVALYFTVSAKHSLEEVMQVAALKAGTTIANPDISSLEGEVLVWRLQADSATEQGSTVALIEPRVDLYLKNQEHMPIAASSGVYDKDKKHVLLKGDVKTTYQAWQLFSQSLDFFEEKDAVFIDDSFKLMQDGVLIEGKKLQISRQDGTIRVFKGVHMELEQNP